MDKKDYLVKKCAQDQYVHSYANKMAPFSKRQMPLYSQVGKGLRGDSATIDLQMDGEPKLVGLYFNQMTEKTETLWELPLLNLVPKIGYKVWEGVREVDGSLRLGFYISFSCSVTIGEGHQYVFWSFDTPFVPTGNFHGEVIPEDHIIDERG